MSDILKYNSWDTTHKALECWNNMPKFERAQHILSGSEEYKVYCNAKSNEANIAQLQKEISELNLPKIRTDIYVPEGVGNVQRK